MKTTTTLGILLLVSLVLNIYFWMDHRKKASLLKCAEMQEDGVPKTIDDKFAKIYSDAYRDSLKGPDKTEGGIIPRSSLDEILCVPGCNAVGYTLAIDLSGKNGPENNGVFIILNGLEVKYDPKTNEIIEVKRTDSKNTLPQPWCPPTCTPR